MVVENKGIISYIRILKEDLEILRIIPEGGTVPDFKAGQFVTLSLSNPNEGGKLVRRAYSMSFSSREEKIF